MNSERFESKFDNSSVSPIEKPRETEEIEGDRKVVEEREEEEKAKKRFGEIFNKHKDGAKRVEDILSIAEPILKSDLIDGEKIRQSLEQCSTIKDMEEFMEKAFSALEPILDLRKNDPEGFEKIKREIFVEQGGFTKINEILSYGTYEDIAHIHLAPAKESKLGIGAVRDGLEKLAKIVEKDKKIERITATSWIVAENPKIMERLGFISEGEISEKEKNEHFANDTHEKISRATITREEFLDRYLE